MDAMRWFMVAVLLIGVMGVVNAFPPGWSNEIQLTTTSGTSTMPIPLLDSAENIHVVWLKQSLGIDHTLFYRKFDKSGNPLTPEVQLTPSSQQVYEFDAEIDSASNVHVTYSGDDVFQSEIYYSKINNGNIIVPATRLTFAPDYSSMPTIDVDANQNVHLVWGDARDFNGTNGYEIYYRKLDNGGNTIVMDTRITFNQFLALWPSTAVDNYGNVHVVYRIHDGNSFHLEYLKLSNGGNTLISSTPINSANSLFPHLIFHNNSLFTVYERGLNVYFMKMNLNGTPLTGEIPIAVNPTVYGSFHPHVKANSNNQLYIMWQENTTNAAGGSVLLYYSIVDEAGNAISPPTKLSNTTAASAPKFVIDNSNQLFVFWGDNRQYAGMPFNGELYYKRTLPPIQVSGISQVGQTMQFHISSPTNPNANYGSALALSSTPTIQWGNETIPLANDWLLQACVSDPLSIGLQNSFGVLDGNGNATVTLNIPPISLANPTPVYFAFASFDTNGTILSVSNALPFTVQP